MRATKVCAPVAATVRYDLMTPAEVTEARDLAPVAYLPLGPLEWHGPHLPLGLDPLHAQAAALGAAEATGGVVLPTLFAGTETLRPRGEGRQSIGALGFTGGERIVGMDLPGNAVRSAYFEESAFGVTVREFVRALRDDGFALVLLVNGHGALNHMRTLQRIADEEDGDDCRVRNHLVFLPGAASGPGHAAREETAIGLALFPQLVRLDRLPPAGAPLPYKDFGIVDAQAFDGHPQPDFAVPVHDDPRAATAEEGEAILREEIDALAELVRAELAAIPPRAPRAAG